MTDRNDLLKALEEDIIFGVLAPGMRLTEDGLMTRFGVTRHSVRQALLDLERIGIVVRERNIGATVRRYEPDDVRDIYQVREFLQRQAALMIPCPPPFHLQSKLQDLNAHFRHAQGRGDLRGVHEANDLFHLTFFEACGNRYLVQAIRDYMNLSLPMRAKSLADAVAFHASAQQHGIMIELLGNADRWALAQLCVDHIQPSKMSYLARVQDTSLVAVRMPVAARQVMTV